MYAIFNIRFSNFFLEKFTFFAKKFKLLLTFLKFDEIFDLRLCKLLK